MNISISNKVHKDRKVLKHNVRNEPVFSEEENGVRHVYSSNKSWDGKENMIYINARALHRPCKIKLIRFHEKIMGNNSEKWISDAFNTKTVQNMYQNTATITRKDRVSRNTHVGVNKGVVRVFLYRRYCLIFAVTVAKDWRKVIRQNISAEDLILSTFVFMKEQMLVASTEGELQRAVCTLSNIIIKSR